MAEQNNKQQTSTKKTENKTNLQDFQQQQTSNDPVGDKIKEEGVSNNNNKAKGIKPEQAVDLVANLTANFIPDVSIKNPNGQVVPVRKHYKQSFKQGKAEILKMVDFEELTEGGDFSEFPEWVRWTIAGVTLGGSALFSVVKLRKEIAQMQKRSSKKPDPNKKEG